MTNPNPNPTPSPDDLQTTILQYLGNELSATDHAEFEARLASDPAVARAVSQVLLLEEALCRSGEPEDAAATLVSLPTTAASSQRRLWASLGTAVAVCIVAGVVVSRIGLPAASGPRHSESVAIATTDTNLAVAVMERWLDTSAAVSALPLENLTASNSVEDDSADLPEPADAAEVPDWMMAAVTASSGNEGNLE